MEDKRLKINDRVVCRLKFHLISRKKKKTHTGISYSSLSLLDLFQRRHWRWQSRGIGYLSEGYLIIHLFIDWVKQVYVTLFTWKEKRSCIM